MEIICHIGSKEESKCEAEESHSKPKKPSKKKAAKWKPMARKRGKK